MLSRRTLITGSLSGSTLAVLGVADGRSAVASDTSGSAPKSADDWLGILAAHRGSVSLQITTVDGTTFAHRATSAGQSASSIKVFHLAAYAEAVDQGRLDPDQRVSVRDWERWYYPADGGAHAKALKRLGIAAKGTAQVAIAANQDATVRLDDIVSAMIRESDNAAADYLRDLIGAARLNAVVARLGAADTIVTSLLGANLLATHASLLAQGPDHAVTRYLSDPTFKAATLDSRTAAGYSAQAMYFGAHGCRTSARDLASVYEHVSDGSIIGVATMRHHLEWQPAQGGVIIGFKGGSLPGVLTAGFELRVSGTKTHASSALLMAGLDQAVASSTNADWQQILVKAMADPAYAKHVTAVLADPAGSGTPVGPMVQTDYVS